MIFILHKSPMYLDSQEPDSRLFPGVAPGSLSLHGLGQAVCNPWSEFSAPDHHRTANRDSKVPRVTNHHQLGSAPKNSSICHAHSHYEEQKGVVLEDHK